MSNRMYDVPFSAIRKLTPYATAAKKRGIKVYHLNIGDPDIETPDIMLSALRNWDMKTISYCPSQGDPHLISSLLSYYHALGYGFLNADHLQITSGGSEAISMAFYAVCDMKDEIIVFEPYYANYASLASINGVSLIPVTTIGANGFHLPKTEEIESKITGRTKAFLLCNPNNPTGTVYTQDEMDMLVSISNKYGLFLIVDEVYREFIYDGQKHISVLDYMSENPSNMILLDSVSKRYNICGARLGMLISLNKDVVAGALKIGQSRLSSGYIDQIMASKLTEVPLNYLREVNQEYKKRRDLLSRELQKIRGVFLQRPEGAFYAIVKLPVKDSEAFCKWLLTDFRHNNETIMLAPAAGFYSSKGKGTDEVRIAYVINSEDLHRAIEILKLALVSYPN